MPQVLRKLTENRYGKNEIRIKRYAGRTDFTDGENHAGCIAEGRNADGSIEKKVESCFWADVFWKGRKAMNFPGSGKKRVFPMQTDL